MTVPVVFLVLLLAVIGRGSVPLIFSTAARRQPATEIAEGNAAADAANNSGALGITIPILIPAFGASPDALRRTLASLARADHVGRSLLVLAGDDSTFLSAVTHEIDWAPVLLLKPASEAGTDRSLSACVFRLLHFAFETYHARGAIVLLPGLELSQDGIDFFEWAERHVSVWEPALADTVFAVNAFFLEGQPFGGNERYTFSTHDAGLLIEWGGMFPMYQWELLQQLWPAPDDEHWATTLATAVEKTGLVCLTPRISRSRYNGESLRGRLWDDLGTAGQQKLRGLYIPDHSIVYEGHDPIITERHLLG